MYKKIKPSRTKLLVNDSKEGETIEKKINRIVNNKEPIKDGAPIIFTERKHGVLPQYDIRTDRFELAVEATDHISKQHLAKRADNIKSREPKDPKDLGQQAQEGMSKEGTGEPGSTQATT